jgi:hypothetical protein
MARPRFFQTDQYTKDNPPPGKIFSGYKQEDFVQRGLSSKSANYGRTQTRQVPVFIDDPGLKIRQDLTQQQQQFQAQQAAITQATQSDIAKQLQIVQQEKSAVAKMQEEYAASLKAKADADRKAQEEAQLALRTSQANQARAGRQANLQIQPAGQTPRTAGTQRFKLRGIMPTAKKALASGLNIGQSNSLNLG